MSGWSVLCRVLAWMWVFDRKKTLWSTFIIHGVLRVVTGRGNLPLRGCANRAIFTVLQKLFGEINVQNLIGLGLHSLPSQVCYSKTVVTATELPNHLPPQLFKDEHQWTCLHSLQCGKQGCIELQTMQKTIHLLHLSNLSSHLKGRPLQPIPGFTIL